MKISCYILTPEYDKKLNDLCDYVNKLTDYKFDRKILKARIAKEILSFLINPDGTESVVAEDITRFGLNELEIIETIVEFVSYSNNQVFVIYEGKTVNLNDIDGIIAHNFKPLVIAKLN